MVKSNLLLIFLLQGKKFTHQPGVISVHILLRLSSDGVGPALPSVLLGSLCTFHSICHVMGWGLRRLQSCWALCVQFTPSVMWWGGVLHHLSPVGLCVQFTPSVRWQGGNVYSSLHLSGDRVGTMPSSVLLNSLCTFHSTFQVTGWGLHHLQSCWTLCVHFTPPFRWRGVCWRVETWPAWRTSWPCQCWPALPAAQSLTSAWPSTPGGRRPTQKCCCCWGSIRWTSSLSRSPSLEAVSSRSLTTARKRFASWVLHGVILVGGMGGGGGGGLGVCLK